MINQELEAATKKLGQVTFLDHNGKFNAKHGCIQEKTEEMEFICLLAVSTSCTNL